MLKAKAPNKLIGVLTSRANLVLVRWDLLSIDFNLNIVITMRSHNYLDSNYYPTLRDSAIGHPLH
jgi:hypothetical protein